VPLEVAEYWCSISFFGFPAQPSYLVVGGTTSEFKIRCCKDLGARMFRPVMKSIWQLFRKLLKPALYAALGAFTVVLVGAVYVLNQKPAPSVWHDAYLDEEFSIVSNVPDLDAYKALEARLFDQLEDKVYANVPETQKTAINRYNKGSIVDPTSWNSNWNKTFELANKDAPFGVLLLHGLSDSPYSLRELGLELHSDGAHVVGLRIPGHGITPSGLRHTTFEDMAAAVELAMADLARTLGDRPLYIAGYSNGGALAVHYAAISVTTPELPAPEGLILFSPEIGITPAAALAGVQAWLGEQLGLDKLAWNSIQPEFDPYKYNSFAVNAGVQAYRATKIVRKQIEDLSAQGLIAKMPRILAFQSGADSTVEAPMLVTELFDKLEGPGHELVIFDVNRIYESQGLLSKFMKVKNLLEGSPRPYKVSLITNKSPKSLETVVKTRPAKSVDLQVENLGIDWPEDVYSLAHIAIPFSPDDPIYGVGNGGKEKGFGFQMGKLAVHGENNTLTIPISALTRQHWNPFYSLVLSKVRKFSHQH
jgi:alpha-beta hydrolase superfamily lysophospholipase